MLGLSDDDPAEQCRAFHGRIGAPARLGPFGLTVNDIRSLAGDTLSDILVTHNSRPFSNCAKVEIILRATL